MVLPFRDLRAPSLLGFVLPPTLDERTRDALDDAVYAALPSTMLRCEPGLLRVDAGSGASSTWERDVELVMRAACPSLGPRVVRVERMVLFDWDRFDARTWAELDRRHRRTLGWIDGPGPARWFSADEGRVPHLWSSVEPPGLQIGGCLDEVRWADWNERYVEVMDGLPVR
jgi:hypothetical protein